MRHLRTALLCAAALSAWLAIAATPASAQLDPEEWKAVEVRVDQSGVANDPDCGDTITCGLGDFADVSWANDGWEWRIDQENGGGLVASWNCDGGLDGEIDADGNLDIDDVWWNGSDPGDPCQSHTGWDFAGLPAQSEICFHEPSEEYWVRVPLTLQQDSQPAYAGDTFALLIDVNTGYPGQGDGTPNYQGHSNNANAIAFRLGIGNYTPIHFTDPNYDWSHRGTIPLERSIELTPTDEVPCSSPYLS